MQIKMKFIQPVSSIKMHALQLSRLTPFESHRKANAMHDNLLAKDGAHRKEQAIQNIALGNSIWRETNVKNASLNK